MELLDQYLALSDDEARAAFLAGLSAEDLATLREQAETRFAEAEAAEVSDENIATLAALADTLEVIGGEEERRESAAETQAAERQAIIDRVRGESDAPAEGEGEGADGGEGDGEGAETPPAEGTPGEPGTEGEGTGDEGGQPGEGTDAPQAVAAGGSVLPRSSRPPLRAVARPAGPHSAPGREAQTQRAALVAAAEVPGYAAGSTLVAAGGTDLEALGQAIVARWNSLAGGRTRQQVIVASARAEYPEERVLDAHNAMLNMERVQPVLDAARRGGDALVAAGGYCAPATIRYDLDVVGDTVRPVRDALPSFQAPRGRARWMASPVLSDVPADALSVWTEQNDIDAADNPHVDPEDDVTKPCARIECPDEDDLTLDALVTCLEFGNFNARTFPELVQAYQRLVAVADTRRKEQRLLTQIDAGSVAVTSAARASATADLLNDLDRLVSSLRGPYRVETTNVRAILPTVAREMVRADMALMMPGGGTFDEKYMAAAERLEAWLRARSINVTWTPDEQIVPLVAAGAIPAHPTTIVARVFVEGTWGFVDGGELNLGVIRDSALVEINSFREFAESWEMAAKFGAERSYTLTSTVCVNGTVSGTSAIAC